MKCQQSLTDGSFRSGERDLDGGQEHAPHHAAVIEGFSGGLEDAQGPDDGVQTVVVVAQRDFPPESLPGDPLLQLGRQPQIPPQSLLQQSGHPPGLGPASPERRCSNC